jgi:hypothetical protein
MVSPQKIYFYFYLFIFIFIQKTMVEKAFLPLTSWVAVMGNRV